MSKKIKNINVNYSLFKILIKNTLINKSVIITGILFIIFSFGFSFLFLVKGEELPQLSNIYVSIRIIYYCFSILMLIPFCIVTGYQIFYVHWKYGFTRIESEAGIKILNSFLIRILIGMIIVIIFTTINFIFSFIFLTFNNFTKLEWFEILITPSLATIFIGMFFFAISSLIVLFIRNFKSLLISSIVLLIVFVLPISSSLVSNKINNKQNEDFEDIWPKVNMLKMGSDYMIANNNSKDYLLGSDNKNSFFINKVVENINKTLPDDKKLTLNSELKINSFYDIENFLKTLDDNIYALTSPLIAALNGFYINDGDLNVLNGTDLGNIFNSILDLCNQIFTPNQTDLDTWFSEKDGPSFMDDYFTDPHFKISNKTRSDLIGKVIEYKNLNFDSFVNELELKNKDNKIKKILEFSKNAYFKYRNMGATSFGTQTLVRENDLFFNSNVAGSTINWGLRQNKDSGIISFYTNKNLNSNVKPNQKSEIRQGVLYFEHPEIMILLNIIANGEINGLIDNEVNINKYESIISKNKVAGYLNIFNYIGDLFNIGFTNQINIQDVLINSSFNNNLDTYIDPQDLRNYLKTLAYKSDNFSNISLIKYHRNYYNLIAFAIFSLLILAFFSLSYRNYLKLFKE